MENKEGLMSRNTVRKYQEEMPEERSASAACDEELKQVRRRQLAEVLSHQGKIELDIDPSKLMALRSTP